MYFNKQKSALSLFPRRTILIATLLFALCADSQFTAPSPRKDSCSFTDQNTLYVLGGSAGTDTPPNPDFFIPKDSFYSLNLSIKLNATSAATTGWKAVTMQGATPVSGHTCVLLPNRVLLVFGSGKKSSNPFLQAFDLKTQLWMPPPPTTIQTELSGLYGHTSGLVGHYVVLTGGKRDLPADGWSTSWTRTLPVGQTIAQPNLDTYVLDVSVGPVWTWTRYRGITSGYGETPSGRMFATSWVISNGGDQLPTFYLTGGLSVAPVNTSNFDGRSIWKFDPVTGEWDKDSRRTLDVSAFGMAAAVVPGTSTVYFQGGQDPTNGTFVTSSRTLDFDAMSDGLPRIISGFAGTDTGRSRHVLNFIDNSTTLAVFGGVTSLNNAINELHFLSVDPPGVSTIFDPKAKVAVGPTPPPVSRPSQDPNPSQGDPIIVIILVFIVPLVAVLLLLLILWVKRTTDRRSGNSTQRRGAKVRREKPHFDLEMGESAAKLLQNVQTNVRKPADTAGKSLPEVPRPPLFAPSALSTVREIIEPSHLYRSIGGDQRLGDKWSYPPLPRMSATNRSSTYTTSGQSNHTDDIESLLWLENRRVSSRRSHDSFGTDSSDQRSSPSFAESSSPFPSSMSNSESVSSRSSNMLDVPVSSRLRWTLSEVYIPKLPPGYAYGNANRTASTSASPECSDHDETASLLSERFSSVDDNIENGSQELRGLQRPQPAYSLPYQE